MKLMMSDWIYLLPSGATAYSPRWQRPHHFVADHFATNYSWRTFSSMVVEVDR